MNMHDSLVTRPGSQSPDAAQAGLPLVAADWHITLVDACCYGRAGLEAALREHPRLSAVQGFMVADSLVGLLAPVLPCLGAGEPVARLRCLVVRLPVLPQAALCMLLQLEALSCSRYQRIVVLSPMDPYAVRHVLLCAGLRCAVRIVDARQAVSVLCQVIMPPTEAGRFPPKEWPGEVLPYPPARVLTRGERRAVGETLREVPIYTQARRAHVSAKTIYSQRSSALLKLQAQDILTLLRRFSPMHTPAASGGQKGWG